MPVVVADTGPLNYLVQIDAIDVLPKVFGKIVIPAAVHDELAHPGAPAMVRAWGGIVPSLA
jgi:predicted nucleic acid-binding protein